jgi:transcriptional regulator with XRE-family HTH domain
MSLKKEEFIKRVGASIRKHRKSKSITLEELALESGIEYSQVSRIERGVINTSIYHVYIISDTLDVPIKQFFNDI